MTYGKDKILFESEWIEIREKYLEDMGVSFIYARGPKTNSQSIAVLPYKRTESGLNFLLRKEIVPPWGSTKTEVCALTGGHDQETPWETAIKELKEESGIVVGEQDLISLGTSRSSKTSDYLCYIYAVEINKDTVIEIAKGDGTALEDKASCVWKTKEHLLTCEDPIVHIMFNRLMSTL